MESKNNGHECASILAGERSEKEMQTAGNWGEDCIEEKVERRCFTHTSSDGMIAAVVPLHLCVSCLLPSRSPVIVIACNESCVKIL